MALIAAGRSVAGSQLDAYLADLAPSEGHCALANLVLGGFVYPLLLTTNFDDLLEKSFLDAGVEPSVYVLGRDSGPWNATALQPGVLKLHGDGKDKSLMKFLPEDVESLGESDSGELAALISRQGLIAIGHRLNDPDLNKLIGSISTIEGVVMAVSPGPLAPSGLEVLDRHRSAANVVAATFDDFASYLHEALSVRQSVVEDAPVLQALWNELDWAISSGDPVHTTPPPQIERTAEGRGYLLIRDWLSPAFSSPLKFGRGLEEMQDAVDESSHATVTKRAEVISRWLWSLGQSRSISVALATSSTLAQATEDAILEGFNLLELCQGRRSPEVWLLKTAVGEALKESYTNRRATTNPQIPTGLECLHRSRTLLASVVTETEGLALVDGDPSSIARARAARHLAVVFEYLGASPGASTAERHDYNLQWNRYSRLAVQVARDSGLLAIAAYSLLNLSASTLHIAESGGQIAGHEELQGCLNWLTEASEAFRSLQDERGQAWAAVHTSRVLMRKLEVQESIDASWTAKSDLVRALDDSALEGRHYGQRSDDFVAHGLSVLYSGIASLMKSKDPAANEASMLRIARESGLEGFELLRRSHRIQQAARCLQLAAEATVSLSRLAPTGSDPGLLGDSVVLLARALEMLSDENAFPASVLESNLLALDSVISSAVNRYRF